MNGRATPTVARPSPGTHGRRPTLRSNRKAYPSEAVERAKSLLFFLHWPDRRGTLIRERQYGQFRQVRNRRPDPRVVQREVPTVQYHIGKRQTPEKNKDQIVNRLTRHQRVQGLHGRNQTRFPVPTGSRRRQHGTILFALLLEIMPQIAKL